MLIASQCKSNSFSSVNYISQILKHLNIEFDYRNDKLNHNRVYATLDLEVLKAFD